MKVLLLLLFLSVNVTAQQNINGTVTVWFWKNDLKEESVYKINIRYVLSNNNKLSFPTFNDGFISYSYPQKMINFNIEPRFDAIQITLTAEKTGHRATPIQGKYLIVITRSCGQRVINNVKWYNKDGKESDILFDTLTSETILTR
jgi:hypothetical protein